MGTALIQANRIALALGDFARTRIRRSHSYPRFERLDLSGRELLLGRHLEIGISIADGMYHSTGLEVSRLESGARVASHLPALTKVEPQSPFLLFGAVALDAVLDEERTHSLFEKLELIWRN